MSESESNGKTNPFDNTIAFCLTIRMPGKTKKVKTRDSKGPVKANKTLFDCPEYEAIQSKAGEIRQFMRSKEVPGAHELFGSGTYPIPIASVEETDRYLQDACANYKMLVNRMCKVYQQRCEEGMNRLEAQSLVLNEEELDLADPTDYPSIERFRAAFDIGYKMVSYSTPKKLAEINMELYRRESSAIQSAAAKASQDTVTALMELTKKTLDHLVERLMDTDGKKKRFGGDLLEKATAFFRDLKVLNITNSEDLNAWSERIGKIIAGVDPETLKDSAATRAMTAKALSQIKAVVDKSVSNLPSRKIELPSEE